MFASSFRLNNITLNAVGFSEAPRTRCRVLHASVYTDLAGDSLYLEITVCLGVRNSSESSWHWFTDSFHWCINCNSVNGTVPSLSVTAAASVSVTVWLGAECNDYRWPCRPWFVAKSGRSWRRSIPQVTSRRHDTFMLPPSPSSST